MLSIDEWLERIEDGQRYKEEYGGCKRWETYRNYTRGKFGGFSYNTSGILPYNLTYAMLRTIVPNVYFRNPHITVTPRFQPGYQTHSKIVEAVDNWLLQELNVKDTFKTGIADAFQTGRCLMKIGYDSQYGFSKDMTADILGKSVTTTTHLDKTKGDLIEYDTTIKPGMPWLLRLLPELVIVPFGVRRLTDCPWIDHISYRFLEDVKADPKYKNTSKLEGTHMKYLNRIPQSSFYQHVSRTTDIVELHEVRDLKTGQIMTFTPGYDKWLRPPEPDILQLEGLPYVDFTFNEDTEYYWPPSDAQILEPQQLECNEARTQAMKHRRIALIKFLVQEMGIDAGEVDKMMSENVGPVVKVKGVPREIVEIMQPHIPPDLVQWVDQIRMDVREVMGFSRQSMGELPPGRRTAREVSVAELGKELRLDERRDAVADALTKAVRKINQIIFRMWDREHVTQVVGVDGAKYWVKYTNKALRGEYNLKVDVESMTPKTKALKKKEIMEIVQTVGKHPNANIDYLLRMLLREYDWVDAMQIFPEAKETANRPMEARDFVRHQGAMKEQPSKLSERAQSNLSALSRLL